MSGLTLSNQSLSVAPFRLVTKADTASSTSLGSATVTANSGLANTYGSWAQLVASTAAESYITELGLRVAGGVLIDSDLPALVQIGTGGGGSETTKWEAMIPLEISAGALDVTVPLTTPFRVTSGKRIAARMRTANTASVNFIVHVFGLPISQTEGN